MICPDRLLMEMYVRCWRLERRSRKCDRSPAKAFSSSNQALQENSRAHLLPCATDWWYLVPLSWPAAEMKACSQNKSMQFNSTRQTWDWPCLLHGRVCPFSLETRCVLQTFAFRANSLHETNGLRVKLNQNFSPQLQWLRPLKDCLITLKLWSQTQNVIFLGWKQRNISDQTLQLKIGKETVEILIIWSLSQVVIMVPAAVCLWLM